MGLEIPWVEPGGLVDTTVSPGFEGFEKRLEVEFTPDVMVSYDGIGLRALGRQDLDRMLKAAECTIVSQLSNKSFDSYVLSESSLFVYPLRIVIKTCGTTKLLRAIPVLLELASSLSLSVRCCKYRRGTFSFPAVQPYPHGSFEEEVNFLDAYFGGLGSGGRGYVLGSPSSGRQWHVYVASTEEVDSSSSSKLTLEMCMTGLERKVAANFFKERNETAAEMTDAAGIRKLLPHSQICDFAFEPCGYSMNSVERDAYSTIHVTPEEVCSYASFETMGYGPEQVELRTLVKRVVDCFKPGFFSMSLYYASSGDDNRSRSEESGSWGVAIDCPDGYACVGSSKQELPGGDAVVYHTFELVDASGWSLSVDPVPLAGDAPATNKACGHRMKQLVSRLACSVSVQQAARGF